MDRKAILLANQVLKMVIAVICIGLLVYLLISLYYTNQINKKRAHAQASIERIGKVIEGMKKIGEVDSITPEGWFLISFVGAQNKPRECANKNCLCVCRRRAALQNEECNEKGACLVVPGLEGFSPIELKTDTRIEFEKNEEGIIEVREK